MTDQDAAMLTAAAAKLRAAGLCALEIVAARYGGLPQVAQMEALVHYAIELTAWYDAALAAVAFMIERPPVATIH